MSIAASCGTTAHRNRRKIAGATPPADSPGELRAGLERVREWALRDSRIDHDPLKLVLSYEDPGDREVAGLLAALLAYGRVDLFMAHLRSLLEALGVSPSRTLRGAVPPLRGGKFDYRFHRAADLRALLRGIRALLLRHGSLREAFALAWKQEGNLRAALGKFAAEIRENAGCENAGREDASREDAGCENAGSKNARRENPGRRGAGHENAGGENAESKHAGRENAGRRGAGHKGAGLRFLLADPGRGGACKRWHLFLRWMIRGGSGDPDPGVWKGTLPPSVLLVPLDTHVVRVSRCLGLTKRRTADWKMAEEVTAALRAICPEDPVRYDFALCHLGISGICPARPRGSCGGGCPLREVCPVGNARPWGSRPGRARSGRASRAGNRARRRRGPRTA